MTPPFSESQKVVTLPLFPPPSPPANFWQVPNFFAIFSAIRKIKLAQIKITANIFPAKIYSRVNIF